MQISFELKIDLVMTSQRIVDAHESGSKLDQSDAVTLPSQVFKFIGKTSNHRELALKSRM